MWRCSAHPDGILWFSAGFQLLKTSMSKCLQLVCKTRSICSFFEGSCARQLKKMSLFSNVKCDGENIATVLYKEALVCFSAWGRVSYLYQTSTTGVVLHNLLQIEWELCHCYEVTTTMKATFSVSILNKMWNIFVTITQTALGYIRWIVLWHVITKAPTILSDLS